MKPLPKSADCKEDREEKSQGTQIEASESTSDADLLSSTNLFISFVIFHSQLLFSLPSAKPAAAEDCTLLKQLLCTA